MQGVTVTMNEEWYQQTFVKTGDYGNGEFEVGSVFILILLSRIPIHDPAGQGDGKLRIIL